MKTIILTFAISLTFIFQSIGQINPIQNLNWDHWYDDPYNFFVLEWDEPESPHDNLIGYNVYREDDLFLFINETSIFNIDSINGIISNCGGEDFLLYNNGSGFFAHVTAVYEPGPVESNYIETVYIEGPMLEIIDFDNPKIMVYPNPTKGKINIENINLVSIEIYNISGKLIREMEPQPQIDLSDFTKGIYLIKLITETNPLVHKIIIE